MRLSNKIAMSWSIFIVWVATIGCTFILNRDIGVLASVSSVFTIVVTAVYVVRSKEKKDGTV